MALVKGTNSYATVDEANAYFADRLDVAAWTLAIPAQHAQALVTATSVLDELAWAGYAVSTTQSLAFPRVGNYFDPKYGALLSLNSVPDRVLVATYELAHHFLNNEGLRDDTGRSISMSIAGLNLNNIIAPSVIPNSIRRGINPLLVNGGSRSWFRAN